MTSHTVLVSGATGFVGLHTVIQLLQAGHIVRGTLRSPGREAEVRDSVARHVDANERLSLHQCDLTSDDGWSEAITGCDYVLHVASPFIIGTPKHEDDLIIPARDGALRVLRAAAKANVKRTVMTSSVAAVSAGHSRDAARVFNEDDWSIVDSPVIGAYEKSKTIAERAAWDFIKSDGAGMELAVINPGAILGPILNADSGTSGELVRQLMARAMPACPRIGFSCVDVRDVASAHLSAMTTPAAAGKRFICAIEFSWMVEIAKILDENFRERGYKIPTSELPNWVPRIMQHFNPVLKQIIPSLGKRRDYNNAQIKSVLNWKPRSLKEMSISMAESMIEFGVVGNK
ncbi:MAG: aldehyde reductase [Marinicaulis sp.]|nr:aldehyde reductase [Marinicaulis sp.]